MGPILAGLAGHAVVSGSFLATLVAFAVTAATIVGLMFGLALAVGLAREAVIRVIGSRLELIKHVTAALLLVVGAWMIGVAIVAINPAI